MQLHTIQILLDRFELTPTEKKIYLTWLELWPATVIQLAHACDSKRVTVHHAIKSMIASGIFLQTYYGKKSLYYPNNYNWLRLLLEEKKFALRQLEQELESTKSVFDAITTSRSNPTNTRLYQWVEWLTTTLVEIARDKQPVHVMYDADSLTKLIDEKLFHRSYYQRSKDKIPTRIIVPEWFRDYWHLERKEDYIISIKTISKKIMLAWGIEIWWSKVALHCYSKWFVTTTIIDNPQIANIMLVMYESMRSQSRDYHEKFLLV